MKNILFISSGYSPQVITETIYYYFCVHKPSFLFDEVHVITDFRGADKIKKRLLGPSGELNKLYMDYNINPKEIKLDINSIHIVKDEEDKFLNDIRSSADNKNAITQIFNLIKNITSDKNNRLFTSIAGGRKTMSVIVGQAMQFFGREKDLLIHVMVDDIFFNTSARDFYYPTPYKKKLTIGDKIIDLSKVSVNVHELPFVRLRPILGNLIEKSKGGNLEDLVNTAQEKIDDLFGPLKIEIIFSESAINVNSYKVTIPAKNLALYTTFLNHENVKKLKNRRFMIDEILSKDFLCSYLKAYKKIKGPKSILYLKEENRIMGDENVDIFYSPEWFMETRSKINKIIQKTLPTHLSDNALIKTFGTYGEKKYGIKG